MRLRFTVRVTLVTASHLTHGCSSDLWSLGLVLLECASGKYPYPESSAQVGCMYGDDARCSGLNVRDAPHCTLVLSADRHGHDSDGGRASAAAT